jgi:hypothetical protein
METLTLGLNGEGEIPRAGNLSPGIPDFGVSIKIKQTGNKTEIQS